MCAVSFQVTRLVRPESMRKTLSEALSIRNPATDSSPSPSRRAATPRTTPPWVTTRTRPGSFGERFASRETSLPVGHEHVRPTLRGIGVRETLGLSHVHFAKLCAGLDRKMQTLRNDFRGFVRAQDVGSDDARRRARVEPLGQPPDLLAPRRRERHGIVPHEDAVGVVLGDPVTNEEQQH